MSMGTTRKRVRFSDNVDEKHISDEEDQEAECEAMEPGDDGATIVAGATMEDLIRQLEPARRKAFLHDLGAAEEDYIEPDEIFNDMGVPIEPFNLRREREEGFFTDDGCFVWHKAKEALEPDAWIDALPAPLPGDDPDDSGQEEAMEEGGAPVMPAAIAAQHRQRIVELLMPGETVVRALQRMGGTARPSGPASSAAWRAGVQQGMQRGRTVPPANKAAFDRLVALSDALMASGDVRVYTDTREQLGRESSQGAQGGADPEEDIFQHDESDDLPGKRRAVGPQPSAAASPRTEPSPMEPPPIEGISGHQGGAHDMAEEDAEGFVMDEASGLLYNSARGLFFDPGSQRFRDAHTGKWFAAAPC